MPMPTGAHQVPGNPNRVTLSNGDVVTRYRARRLGAQQLGFRNERAYTRKESAGDDKYYRRWSESPNGRAIIEKEKAFAAREGRKYSEAEMKQRLISARNARPHGDRFRRPGVPGKAAGSAFTGFLSRYDIDDERDIDY